VRAADPGRAVPGVFSRQRYVDDGHARSVGAAPRHHPRGGALSRRADGLARPGQQGQAALGSSMIRSFDWRDVGLVKTLADRGVCLDSETGLTQGNHPLQHALVSYLMPMGGVPTLIWRADGNHSAMFGQLSHRPGEGHARVLYMAPEAELAGEGWQQLIER